MGQGPYVLMILQQCTTTYLPQGKGFNKLKSTSQFPVLFSTHNAQVFCAMCSVYV